jgi:hydrogenase/urease accessory protein HupE
VLLCLGDSPASSHPAPFSYLDLKLSAEGIHASLVVHLFDLARELGRPGEGLLGAEDGRALHAKTVELLRDRAVLSAGDRPLEAQAKGFEILLERQAVKLDAFFPWDKEPGVLLVRGLLFPDQIQHRTFLNLYEEGRLVHQEILDAGHVEFRYFTGTTQGRLALVGRFISEGIHHILAGPDHIFFLVGLLLLGGSLTRLLLVVTSFTGAHSITLSLAVLGLWNPPARIIEPSIALSIVIVGLDNLMARGEGRDLRGWIAFGFGLIHGFGFAIALQDTGLPRHALGWTLFSFNFGVEIGQAALIIVAALVLSRIRHHDQLFADRFGQVCSAGLVLAGAYWFFERAFFQG